MNSNKLNVGSYSAWLKEMIGSLNGENESAVQCGKCTACCTSSHFIHIKPTDTETFKHIPANLIFPAPGLPKGHYLLGYDENGHCPMFSASGCTIYNYRPQTCRQYDCRIFSATDIKIVDKNEKAISSQVDRWTFDIDSAQDIADSTAVKSAASFIETHLDRFPKEMIPNNATQKAVMAIRIYGLFVSFNDNACKKEVESMIAKIVEIYTKESGCT